MTVRDVREVLGARVLAGEEHLDREVRSACGSDMMSDVLAFSKDHSVLLTGSVSYTHLDVYKRQEISTSGTPFAASSSLPISNFFAVQGITLTDTISFGSMPIFSA